MRRYMILVLLLVLVSCGGSSTLHSPYSYVYVTQENGEVTCYEGYLYNQGETQVTLGSEPMTVGTIGRGNLVIYKALGDRLIVQNVENLEYSDDC